MSIKKNFLYNSLLTLSQYLVAIVIFPYISRVLGLNNIGVVSFVDYTINYFTLFSLLGINIVGVREIAQNKGEKGELSLVYSRLMTLSFCLLFIVLIVYFFLLFFLPQFNQYKSLFLVGVAKLIASSFLIEWLYKGLENFKYIAIRTVLIRLIYIITVFLFVKDESDTLLYFVLTVMTVVFSAFANMLFSRRYVDFKLNSCVFLREKVYSYLKDISSLGLYTILTSMYTTFNIMYLGIVRDVVEVGYYYTALKVYSVILGFYSAFTGIMMPRMSSLIKKKNNEEFRFMILKSFDLLFCVSFPIIVISFVFSPYIIDILAGSGYEGAIVPMRIIMPLILFVGVAQVLAIQVLIPLQMNKIVLKASIIGAFIGILSNFYLVGRLGSVGSSIVLIISEVSVTVYYIVMVMKKDIVRIPWNLLVMNLLFTIPYIIVCLLSMLLFDNIYVKCTVGLIATFLIWSILQFSYFKKYREKLIYKNK